MRDNRGVDEQELRAVVEARKELGPEHEEHLIQAFLARLDARAAEPRARARPVNPYATIGMRFALTIVSLVAGIPITAIALTQSGLTALVVCWAGIVAVNVVFARLSR